jgi:hypothetical protein
VFEQAGKELSALKTHGFEFSRLGPQGFRMVSAICIVAMQCQQLLRRGDGREFLARKTTLLGLLSSAAQ